MQRRQQALRGGALGLERAVGEEAGAISGMVFLSPAASSHDELDRAATGEEREHHVGLLRRDLGQQGLELDVRERQVQILDDLAAALLEGLGKTPTVSLPAAWFQVIVIARL